jgi:hypothetical protein
VRSQVAIEYILMVAFAMLVMIFLVPLIKGYEQQYRDLHAIKISRKSLMDLEDGINMLCTQGRPARMKIDIYLPANVFDSYVENRRIGFWLRTSGGDVSVERNPNCNVTGWLPREMGYYSISLISLNGVVNVTSSG